MVNFLLPFPGRSCMELSSHFSAAEFHNSIPGRPNGLAQAETARIKFKKVLFAASWLNVDSSRKQILNHPKLRCLCANLGECVRYVNPGP